MRESTLVGGALLLVAACEARRFDLGHESDPGDPPPLVLAPALCADGGAGRAVACAATLRWWFAFGDERDDAVRGITLDDADGVLFAAALANDRDNAWRPQAYVGALSAGGRLRWSSPVAHRNRNWADTGVGALWAGAGRALFAGHHGISGHQYIPWLDEIADDGTGLLRKLTIFGNPDCAVYPCGRLGSQELAAVARAADGWVWAAGIFQGEPDVPLPWLERPTPGRDAGHGVIVGIAGGAEPWMGRTLGDLRIERLTDVAAAPAGDAVAIGTERPDTRLDPPAATAAVLLRIGRDGALRWSRPLRAARVSAPRLAVDATSGRILVTLGFSGTLDLGDRTLAAATAADAALVALDPDGRPLWALSWPQHERDRPSVVALDRAGDVFVAAAVGPGRAAGLLPAAGPGAWLGRFTRDGAHRSSAAIASGAPFDPLALAVTRDGTAIVAGAFAQRLALPGRELARAAGGADAVVLALTPPLR